MPESHCAPLSDSGSRSGPDTGATSQLKILIVDDERTNLLVLRTLLEFDGHKVLMAGSGREAIAVFLAEQPDMVLMDVMMPSMDGYETTHVIKAASKDRFVPVIFLTALSDEQALARCVQAGGDDFLTKPYSRVILRSKISAMARIRNLHVALQARNDELALHHGRLRAEHEIAEKVLAKVTHRGCLDAPGIRYLLSPMSIFNGDLLMAARRPSGGVRVMLGDFAGHGLSAAVGAMPASEIFYVMTAKGYALNDIVAELNRKLKLVLPPDMFLAACLLDIDSTRRTVTVWNGGIPDILIHAGSDRPPRPLSSRHLPLGVLDNSRLDGSVEMHAIEPGSRLFLYTDGLLEARNPAHEQFGEQRLARLFRDNRDPSGLFGEIKETVAAFRDGAERSDDLTLVEIDCDLLAAQLPVPDRDVTGHVRLPATWQMHFDLDAEIWKAVDPLPGLVQFVTDIQGLHEHKERLYMILGELLTNALDHGLLRLDSRLKDGPQGFDRYYAARAAALAGLREGSVRVELRHAPLGEGGRLVVRVTDSGPGFDFRSPGVAPDDGARFRGRGIPLVRGLCHELVYHGSGNDVEAVYVW